MFPFAGLLFTGLFILNCFVNQIYNTALQTGVVAQTKVCFTGKNIQFWCMKWGIPEVKAIVKGKGERERESVCVCSLR